MSDFGELRSLLHDAEPSQEAFARVVVAFREARDQGEVERVWLPYATEHLERWPDEARSVTLYTEGEEDTIWFALARALRVKARRWSAGALEALLTSDRLVGVVRLEVDKGGPVEVVEWLARSEHVGALRSLSVKKPRGGALSLRGVDRAEMLRLESLLLPECKVGDAGLELLARSPASASLRALDLSYCGVGGQGMRAWARSEHLVGVRSLNLASNAMRAGELDLWAHAPGHAAFERLNLGHDPLGDRALRGLLEAQRLDGCEALDLGWCGLSDEGVALLFETAKLDRLTTLELNGNGFGAASWEALSGADLTALEELEVGDGGPEAAIFALRSAGMPALGQVSSAGSGGDFPAEVVEDRSVEGGPLVVSLAGCGMGPDAAHALAQTRRMRGATEVYLSHNPIGVEGARALGASPNVGAVKTLDLELCGLGDDGLAALLTEDSGGRLSSLTRLDLMSNDLSDASRWVLPSSGLTGLETLIVEHNAIGPDWIAALVGSPVSASLDVLHVNDTEIGDEGMIHIGSSPYLGALEKLYCGTVGASGVGLCALLGSEVMCGLTLLDVRGARIDDEVALAFASSPSVASLSVLCLDMPEWSFETWRVFVRSPNLRALEFLETYSMEVSAELLDALELERSEGGELNPWARG